MTSTTTAGEETGGGPSREEFLARWAVSTEPISGSADVFLINFQNFESSTFANSSLLDFQDLHVCSAVADLPIVV
jgi:hypothetical protein